MSDRFPIPWPRLELVSVSGERLPSSWAERFPTLDVPGELSVGGCRPVALRLVTIPGSQELIQFGEMPNRALCLDPFDGRVVDIITGPAGDILRGPLLVNSSMRQYVVTVVRATACFPYDDGREDADFDAIAEELREHLTPIDPPAWQVDGYWDSFCWDVTAGDYHSILFERR